MASKDEIVWFCDIATNLGVAFGPPGSSPVFGSLRFGDSDSSHEHRFSLAYDWAYEFCQRYKPDVWSYETPMGAKGAAGKSNINTQLLLNGLPAVIGLAVYHAQIRRRFRADVGDIRQHFIQRRNLKRKEAKKLTIEKCEELGWNVKNDNEADACAGWSYMCSCIDPDVALRTTPLFNFPRAV